MIDIEGFGMKTGSVVTSIAAVAFNRETGETGQKFYMNIDLQDSLNSQLKIEADTLRWWMTQKDSIRDKMFDNAHPLENVLYQFDSFFEDLTAARVWGNSARFDLEKIVNLYSIIGFNVPWNTRHNERCYKTYSKDFAHLALPKELEKEHDPIYDCEYQIKNLCHIWKTINSVQI